MKFYKIFIAALAIYSTTTTTTAAIQNDTISTKQLEEIIVTGSNQAVGRNLLPYTVSSISSAQLEATGNTQLLSALSGLVPSLFVTERNIFGFGVSNGGSGHIKMRGIGGDRASAVLMMVDGQPQFAGLYSHHVADFYNTENVERVEVLRGPASVLYGSNAMAGVINIITGNPQTKGVKTILTSQYGSYNTWLSSLTNTLNYGKFSSIISASYNRTDGLRENFDCNQISIYAKAGYKFNRRWNFNADYSLMSFTGNDPVYPSLKGETGIYHQRVIRGESSVSIANNYAATNGVARIYYSYGNHFIHDPKYFHSLDDRFGILIYQNFRPWNGATSTLGFDFDRYTGKIPVSGGKDHTEAPLATLERKAINEYSPYLTLSQSLCKERIILNAGLRMANSNLFGTQWIPQGGITFSPAKGWMLKAAVAKGYRNPSFRELYLYKFANPLLQPENMMNYEITLAKHINRYISFDLTGYYARGNNLIQQGSSINENSGKFINKGIEITANSNPVNFLTLRASYSYLHTSLRQLTGAPKNQYYICLGWDAFKGFHADAELKGVGGLYVADVVDIQNYAALNIRISYKVCRPLQLFLNLDNLTDTHYTINFGYPMPGITIAGGFKLTL